MFENVVKHIVHTRMPPPTLHSTLLPNKQNKLVVGQCPEIRTTFKWYHSIDLARKGIGIFGFRRKAYPSTYAGEGT